MEIEISHTNRQRPTLSTSRPQSKSFPSVTKGADTLKNMARPKIFEAPNVKLQRTLVKNLEAALDKAAENVKEPLKTAYLQGEIVIGGIELVRKEENWTLKDILSNAKFIPIKNDAIQASAFDVVKEAGLQEGIINNTLDTMNKAGQLDYLSESGIIDKEWKVIIEIHYVRDRNHLTVSKLHKDTYGETLFVNLNYLNEEEINGPEYIVNPESDQEDQDRLRRNLPPGFVDDLHLTKSTLDDPKVIETNSVMPNGVVAFVDEAIHHMTPVLAHRKIKAQQIIEKYPAIEEAFAKYVKLPKPGIFEKDQWKSLLPKEYQKDAGGWKLIILTAKSDESKGDLTKTRYDRKQLRKLLSHLPENNIEELIEFGQFSQFGVASIPKFTPDGEGVSKPVKKGDAPPLKRRMSQVLPYKSKESKPKAAAEKRAFFRTWVRAVRM